MRGSAISASLITRIEPGGQSSCRHAHSRQDEFVYVLDGEATVETDAGLEVMKAGSCIGFPAGTGDGHRFLNKTDEDVCSRGRRPHGRR